MRIETIIENPRRARICDNEQVTGFLWFRGCLNLQSPILNPEFRGRLGFDVGCEAVQGIPRASDLVNTTGTL